MNIDYSIHYYAWTQTEIFELILIMGKTLNFKFIAEFFLINKDEVIIILKKNNMDIQREKLVKAIFPKK